MLAAVSSSRAADPVPADGMEFFEKHVRPLLAAHCYSCHSSRAKNLEGGLLLDSRAGWSAGGENGPAIVPGDVDASLLIRAVRYTDPDLQMPPDRALPPSAIARLEQWVRMGAPDPREVAPAENVPQNDPSDPVAGRKHWAYQPLAETQPPEVKSTGWPLSPIDAFVLSRLEAQNLPPAPDADRRTLIRRLYFDLIGLPPTPRQIDAYLNDRRDDATARLVDRLLDSPHFGERWGRHWLDLARYADSNGLDENFLFREAWRYRNWVIHAVNHDLPFDRFLLEQIAGDLLPCDSIDQRDRQRIAAGFLVVGPKVLLGNDEQNQRMEIADEQLDTIGRSILGQTLGCARCHDHKFDPIPTADYYALAGILTSTQVMERRYMLNEQRFMERLVGLGPEGEAADAAYEQYWRELADVKRRQKWARSALELLNQGDEEALREFAGKHADALAERAADTSAEKAARVEAQQALIASLEAATDDPPEIPPRAMIPCDVEAPADESIRLAGRFDQPGAEVPRGFLRVLSTGDVEIADDRSGRLELARWLTDVDVGAGSLAARVLANRVWHHLIGRGIVRTVDNFGRTGEPPTHPELLEYLAAELVASGWSIKDLVRQVVLSRTFAMSSHHDNTAYSLDPDNRLLWRAHRRRLDPESMRDAMLAAAGELDLMPMDSTVWYLEDQATAVGDNKNRRRTDFPCRSVYLPVIRNDLPEVFDVFNFANPQATTGMRPQTLVATQGLFLLNDETVMAAAESTARRLHAQGALDRPEEAVDRMFELVLNVLPSEQERADVLTFVQKMRHRLDGEGDEDAQVRAWSMACHALFASSRFQVLE